MPRQICGKRAIEPARELQRTLPSFYVHWLRRQCPTSRLHRHRVTLTKSCVGQFCLRSSESSKSRFRIVSPFPIFMRKFGNVFLRLAYLHDYSVHIYSGSFMRSRQMCLRARGHLRHRFTWDLIPYAHRQDFVGNRESYCVCRVRKWLTCGCENVWLWTILTKRYCRLPCSYSNVSI